MDLRVRVTHADTAGGMAPSLEGDASGWTGEFADWLVEDRRLGRHGDVKRGRSSSSDGGMSGDLVDWISLAVTSGSFIIDLILVYGHFRASLPRLARPAARLIVEHGDTRVVVEEGTVEDAARVARLLNVALEGNEGASQTPSGAAVTPTVPTDTSLGGETSGGGS